MFARSLRALPARYNRQWRGADGDADRLQGREDADVKSFHSRTVMFLIAGAAALLLAATAAAWLRMRNTVPTRAYVLDEGHRDEWTPIGGDWHFADNVVYDNSFARGAKLLTGSHAWNNLKFNADIQFKGDNADMGVMVRTNDEQQGTDTYNGYYIGLRTLDGTMVVGRSNFGWTEAQPVTIPGGVHSSTWYRLQVVAVGCNIAASVQNLSTGQTAWIAFQESFCVHSGRIGLRSLNRDGAWRNVSVAPAGWSDYMALARHAASVEHLEVTPGPPWWTPWHAGLLFGGILALALFTQLTYFRIRQWKADTIARERERLAHDIHDTMAQSFAGIGYQIQGIRHSIVCGDRVDSTDIAEQLGVAYQLVRKCHEEASRTIAMLGSRLTEQQPNLLQALTETAHKIASDQIRTVAECHGSPAPLSLRLSDALLQIGREAIVNAVGHSEPRVLRIVLRYEANSVELLVEDDGKGFHYTPDAARFGIYGMQKVARDVGGTLQILSEPGNGTRVRVTARLHRESLLKRMFTRMRGDAAAAQLDFHAR